MMLLFYTVAIAFILSIASGYGPVSAIALSSSASLTFLGMYLFGAWMERSYYGAMGALGFYLILGAYLIPLALTLSLALYLMALLTGSPASHSLLVKY